MTVDHAETIHAFASAAAHARYRDLLAGFVARHGAVVQTGPFAGMTLPPETSWGHGDLLPKLIGCYEAELHRAINEAIAWEPDRIVNIGAAEGYYAVGFARAVPQAHCHAFDVSEAARTVCASTATLNAVDARLTVSGGCTTDTLGIALSGATRAVVLSDCEGAEVELMDVRTVPALASAMLVIECHDFLRPGLTETLVDRLSTTHDLFVVSEGARDPNTVPFLRGLSSVDRWIAVCEFRPSTMHWLYGRPKAG